mmetsp:Transcript_44016/g.81804  ORF Transcript_44016/g.81804 Transcript_44016/m.81804 type:complete len:480 (+) Transcript_44016:80-1519(+)
MADWIIANVPNGRDLILDLKKNLDDQEKLSAPLGPYCEQAHDFQRSSVQRFLPEEERVPPMEELLARLDQEETAIVPVCNLAQQLEQQRLEAAAVREEFLALGVSIGESASSSTARAAGNLEDGAVSNETKAHSGILAKPPSEYERARAEWLGATPLAQTLRLARGVELPAMLAQNPMQEEELVGFTPHRITGHLSEVEKEMRELLENKMGWMAIKDAEIDEQQRRLGRKTQAKGRRRGSAAGGLVHGLNLPKAKAKRVPSLPASSTAKSEAPPAEKKKKRKKSRQKERIPLEAVQEEEEESEGEEVDDAQCNECGIYGLMNRCRKCDALLCSMSCREQHNESTCSGKLLGGASSSGSSGEESDEDIVGNHEAGRSLDQPSQANSIQDQSEKSHTINESFPSLGDVLANLDKEEELQGRSAADHDGEVTFHSDESVPLRPVQGLEKELHESQAQSLPDDAIPGLDELLARLDADELDNV